MVHDLPTDIVTGWLVNDPDYFYHAQELVNEWYLDSANPEDVVSDLESYILETLDNAGPYSAAGAAREKLSDLDLQQVNWEVVLGHLVED